MSLLNSETKNRTVDFSRNTNLEFLLRELNDLLSFSEKKILDDYYLPKFPIVFIVGPIRSGTTLMMQWLANSGIVSYPSNLLSRFYAAPIIGAKIQLLLTDPRYNFRDELSELMSSIEYSSENGKTKGVLAPNEFWYFWRRFLADSERDVWSDEELELTMDVKTMVSELAGVMDVYQKPFVAKGMLFNYNISFLNSIFEKALFVQMKRDIVTNVASVLDARKRQLGAESAWYSFKIPEYEQLKNLDPITQVVGQVMCNDRAVSKGLQAVPDEKKIVVNYEDFCATPKDFFQEITRKIGVENDSIYTGPCKFDISRSDDKRRDQITAALQMYK